jgi:hypothetical protein
VAFSGDIRDQLRRDHEAVLAELQALHPEADERAAARKLAALRRSWVIHALCVETVVFPALSGVEHATSSGTRAIFDTVAQARPGSMKWHARLKAARELIEHHIGAERDLLFAQIARRLDGAAMQEMGRNFERARDKLTLLEEAKAA